MHALGVRVSDKMLTDMFRQVDLDGKYLKYLVSYISFEADIVVHIK